MGRKTNSQNNSQTLHHATAEAARILSQDLAAYSAVLNLCLKEAAEEEDHYDRDGLIETAGAVALSMAKLGDTIGGLNGELRQHISVERNAPRTEIAPKSAPNSAAPQTKNLAQTLGKTSPRRSEPRGEGGR